MNNSVTLVGRVGQDPSVKTFPSGKKVANFSIAVREFAGGSDRDRERALWIDIKAWDNMADRVIATITKGREVVIQGRLALDTRTRKVNGMDVEITVPVVRLGSFHLCGKKPQSDSDSPATPSLDTSADLTGNPAVTHESPSPAGRKSTRKPQAA